VGRVVGEGWVRVWTQEGRGERHFKRKTRQNKSTVSISRRGAFLAICKAG
jgi:hypothetical protein